MTSPVFLTDAIAAGATIVRLVGPEAQHAHVMRLAPGDRVDVVDGRGTRAAGRVTAASREELTVAVDAVTHEGDAFEVVLVQALAKGGRDEAAIEAATEVGVDAVVPWQAERCIAQWPAANAGRAAEKWAQVLRAAAKQSRRSRVPELLPLRTPRTLPELVASTVAAGGAALVLHEAAEAWLPEVPLPAAGRVLVVVGPEGGITDSELAGLVAAGARPVLAGPHVMRSGTAGPIAVSHVNRAVGRWGRSDQSG